MVSFHKIRPETYFTPGVSGNPQGATVSLEKLDIYIYYNFYFAKKYIYKVTQYGSAYIHVLCLEYVSDQTYVQFCFTILFIFISACHIKNSQPSYLSLSFPFVFSVTHSHWLPAGHFCECAWYPGHIPECFVPRDVMWAGGIACWPCPLWTPVGPACCKSPQRHLCPLSHLFTVVVSIINTHFICCQLNLVSLLWNWSVFQCFGFCSSWY